MLYFRKILLLGAAGGLVVAALLGFVVAMTWWGSEYLDRVSAHAALQQRLQLLHGRLVEGAARQDIAADLRDLAARQPLRGDSAAGLVSAADLLEQDGAGTLAAARDLTAEVLAREATIHQQLVAALGAGQRRALDGALALAIVLPVLLGLSLLYLLRRVLAPLRDLGNLLGLMARKDYHVVEIASVDPLVQPLFEKYNRMVKRMHDVEQGHLKREDSLRQEVDQATKALVQQQAAMSRSERLAAVGEFSARLGHELRNPLSGVLMALTNLRAEIDSQDQDERLGLAIAELERIANLLSTVVDGARQAPERPQRFYLASVVDEVAGLLRYQLEDHVALETDVPADLWCRMPEGGLRHALFNLVLNSAHALGERPGRVCISARQEEDAVAISVSDDGPGFPEDLLATGVHDFGTWRHDGSGLGLATVRRYAFACFGRLKLTNLPEGGARVTLLLPLEESGGKARAAERGQ